MWTVIKHSLSHWAISTSYSPYHLPRSPVPSYCECLAKHVFWHIGKHVLTKVNYQKLVQIWIIPGSVHQFCCWFSWRSIFCNEVGKVALVTKYIPIPYMPYISVTCQTSNRYPKSRGKIILGTFVRGNWEVHDTANISKNKYHLVIKYGWLENPWTRFLDGGFNGEIVQLAHQYPSKSHFSYPIESPENISLYKLHPLTSIPSIRTAPLPQAPQKTRPRRWRAPGFQSLDPWPRGSTTTQKYVIKTSGKSLEILEHPEKHCYRNTKKIQKCDSGNTFELHLFFGYYNPTLVKSSYGPSNMNKSNPKPGIL